MACKSTIRLESCDGVVYEVDRVIISRSCTIRTMINDLSEGDANQTFEEVIPLQNVTSAILKKWCEKHKDDEAVGADSDLAAVEIGQWDAEFLKVDQETLFEIIRAANYLDIRGLLEVGMQTVVNKLKGKSTEEMCTILNVRTDFTSADERMLNENVCFRR